jgi:hypothetical protein
VKRVTRDRLIQFAPIISIAALGMGAQIFYVDRSGGDVGGLTEVPRASKSALLDELGRLSRERRRPIVVSDTSNAILAMLESLYMKPAGIRFATGDFYEHLMPRNQDSAWFALSQRLSPALTAQALRLLQIRAKVDGFETFDMKESGTGVHQNPFFRWNELEGASEDYDVIESSPAQSPLNQYQYHSSGYVNFRLMAGDSVSDLLIPVASELGGSRSLSGRLSGLNGRIALYPAEPDFFYRNSTMNSVGRYLLFQVLRPAARFRLVLDYTASLNADGENRIPPVAVIGDQRLPMAAFGRGSARLVSAPLEPQTIDGQAYLMLDMGAEPKRFPSTKRGLMALYGRAILMDPRFVVGFVRDISVLSEQQYAAFTPPADVERFPDDLRNPSLEYSGIYEDGWNSEDSMAVLVAPAAESQLRLRGFIPQNGGDAETHIALLLDGQEVESRTVGAGEFSLQCEQAVPGGKHRVEIRASRAFHLAAPDNRPAAFLIRYFGFAAAPAKDRTEITEAPLKIGAGWYPFEKFQGETFRWVANAAAFSIPSAAQGSADVILDLQSGPGLSMSAFDLSLQGPDGEVRTRHVPQGRQTVRFGVQLARGDNRFVLHVSGGGRPAAKDSRILNFRVFKLKLDASNRTTA